MVKRSWGADRFFVLRTPLLPVEAFTGLAQGLEAAHAHADELEGAVSRDCQTLGRRLHEFIRRPEVVEALRVGATEFAELLAGLDAEALVRNRKLARTLVGYHARLTTRPTPYGLFAGVSLGTIDQNGPETAIELQPRGRYRRDVDLDVGCARRLARTLAVDPSCADHIRLEPNSTVYRVNDRLRYLEVRGVESKPRFELAEIEAGDVLDWLLRASARRLTRNQLAQELLASPLGAGIEFDEARDFIAELVENQLLCPHLGPEVVGLDAVSSVLEGLAPGTDGELIVRLTAVRKSLQDIAAVPVGDADYGCIEAQVGALLGQVSAKPGASVAVNLHKPAAVARLGKKVVEELEHGIDLLHRLFGKRNERDSLREFRRQFRRRYGEGRRVDLCTVLDEELGLGYPVGAAARSSRSMPLLSDLPPLAAFVEEPPFGALHRTLLRRMELSGTELVLDAAELTALTTGNPEPLPDSFLAVARIAGKSADAIRDGQFTVWIEGVSGPSAARLLGRFCRFDEDLRGEVERHLAHVQSMRPEAIIADVAHLPPGDLGNVVLRPALASHAIPYLGQVRSAQDSIPVSELSLLLDGDRLVLVWDRNEREVVPRFTSAHLVDHRSLGVYRLLSDLQYAENACWLSWNWGPLSALDALPRVVVGRVVLAPARWRIPPDELRQLLEPGRRPELYSRFRDWRKRRGLPRWVVFDDFELPYTFDFDNVLSVESLAQVLRGRHETVLTELFPPPDEAFVRSTEGRFIHQMVVPFRREKVESGAPRSLARILRAARHDRATATWRSTKIYALEPDVERLLLGEVGALARQAQAAGRIEKWFFIRYHDPECHLRLRAQGGSSAAAFDAELADLGRSLLGRRVVSEVVFDRYEPEVERYGGPEAIEQAETIFWADSEAVLSILPALESEADRWRAGVLGCDALLRDCGLPLAARAGLMERLRRYLTQDLGVSIDLKRAIGDRYRTHREDLDALLRGDSVLSSMAEVGACLDQRRRYTRAAFDRLRVLQQRNALSRPIEDVIGSLVHMFMNRLFASQANLHELVLYDFLLRHYRAQLGRAGARGDI